MKLNKGDIKFDILRTNFRLDSLSGKYYVKMFMELYILQQYETVLFVIRYFLSLPFYVLRRLMDSSYQVMDDGSSSTLNNNNRAYSIKSTQVLFSIICFMIKFMTPMIHHVLRSAGFVSFYL